MPTFITDEEALRLRDLANTPASMTTGNPAQANGASALAARTSGSVQQPDGQPIDIDKLIADEGAQAAGPLIRAIRGQESSNGQVDTSQPNYAGARGSMQVTRNTFDLLKSRGMVPGNWQWDNEEHNARAGIKLLKHLGEKYQGDNRKTAAAYYSGERVILPDGSIDDSRRDRLNPNAPLPSQYADQVLARLQPDQVAASQPTKPKFPQWPDIENSERYQSETDEVKKLVRQGYFDRVIKPNVATEDLEEAYKQFQAASEPSLWKSTKYVAGRTAKDLTAAAKNVAALTMGAKANVGGLDYHGAQGILSDMDAIDRGEKPAQGAKYGLNAEGKPVVIGMTDELQAYKNGDDASRATIRAQVLKRLLGSQEMVNKAVDAVKAYQAESLSLTGKLPELRDVETARQAANYVARKLPAAIPSMAALVVGGLAGGAPGLLATSGTLAVGDMGSDRANFAKDNFDPKRFSNPDRRAQAQDQQAANIAQYVGDHAGETVLEAIPYAALDLLGPAGAAARHVAAGTVKQALSQGMKKLPGQMLGEAAGEGGQEAIKIAGEMVAGERQTDLTKDDAWRLADAAAGGAIGGAFGHGLHTSLQVAEAKSGAGRADTALPQAAPEQVAQTATEVAPETERLALPAPESAPMQLGMAPIKADWEVVDGLPLAGPQAQPGQPAPSIQPTATAGPGLPAPSGQAAARPGIGMDQRAQQIGMAATPANGEVVDGQLMLGGPKAAPAPAPAGPAPLQLPPPGQRTIMVDSAGNAAPMPASVGAEAISRNTANLITAEKMQQAAAILGLSPDVLAAQLNHPGFQGTANVNRDGNSGQAAQRPAVQPAGNHDGTGPADSAGSQSNGTGNGRATDAPGSVLTPTATQGATTNEVTNQPRQTQGAPSVGLGAPANTNEQVTKQARTEAARPEAPAPGATQAATQPGTAVPGAASPAVEARGLSQQEQQNLQAKTSASDNTTALQEDSAQSTEATPDTGAAEADTANGERFARPGTPHEDGPAGRRATMADADAIIGRIRAAMPHAPQIVSLETVAQAPKALREAIRQVGAQNNVEAAYHDGQIYVWPKHSPSVKRLAFVLMHHEIRHHGIQSILGKNYRSVLMGMWETNQKLRKAANQKMQDGLAKSVPEGVDEALADMPAEEIAKLNHFNRFVASFRTWLRNLAHRLRHSGNMMLADAIDPKTWTDNDIAAFVARAENVSKNGAPLFTNAGGTVFSHSGEAESQTAATEPATKDSRLDEPRYSRKSDQPEWISNGPEALKSAASKIDTYNPRAPLSEKWKTMTANWREKLVQGMADAYHPLKKLSPEAYVAARMVKAADGAFEGMLGHGMPVLDDEGGLHGKLDGKGFIGAMQDLKGEHDRFFMWVAGNRAQALSGKGKENLFTSQEIQSMVRLNDGKMADGSSRPQAYAKAAETLRQYNKAVMDIAEKTGLVDGESRAAWEQDIYVPFYRVSEDDTIAGPGRVKGLVRQEAFKRLKGGTENLGDLMENTLRNWSHLLSASMANLAAKKSLLAATEYGVATEANEATVRDMATAAGKSKSAVFFVDHGVQRWFTVGDSAVLDAITSMAPPPMSGMALKTMSAFKHALTLGTTISPAFKVRNLIRDTIAAPASNEMSYNVIGNLVDGWKATAKHGAEHAQMLFGGAMMRFGTSVEGDRAKYIKKLINAGIKDDTILTTPEKVKAATAKLWNEYQEFGDRMENINRAAVYKQLRDKGLSHLEASFQARDMMDFSMQGSWAAMRMLTQVVPFLNARVQGLYKLGRAANQNPKRFGIMTGAVALASMALLLAYKDDPDWQDREDWDRDGFWWFKIGDEAFRIPKPFEIGAMGTIAERSLELMVNDEFSGVDFARRMKSMVQDTFAINPIPQMAKPMIDLYANTDSFTGRDIETQGLERLSKSERYTNSTSWVARVLGSAGDFTNVSPVQIDHLIRAYFGWLGTMATASVDAAVRPFEKGEAPAYKWEDFSAGFARSLPDSRSRYLTKMYEQAREVNQLMADIRRAREMGDNDKADRLQEDNAEKIAKNIRSALAAKAIAPMGRAMEHIRNDEEMSGDEKRQAIDETMHRRNQIAKDAVKGSP